ncbi:MAG: hypothetical protein IKJ69_04110 [Clostridia bacterium]|nr:hypothetical protein [Clostridia bacterium]
MKRILAVLLMTVVIFTCFNACRKEETDDGSQKIGTSTGLVIILGNHANAKRVTRNILEEKEYAKLIKSAYTFEKNEKKQYTARANIAVIVADGNPQLEKDLEGFNMGNLDTCKRKDTCEDNIEMNNEKLYKILTDDTRLRAQEPGVDLVTAFREAVNYLNNLDVDKRTILCFDTMIPTQGMVDFTKLNYAEKSAQELYDEVYSLNGNRLPNFDGIEVMVDGLVDVCGYQSNGIKDSGFKTTIESFWKLFFGDSNVKSIKSNDLQGTEMNYIENVDGSYPYVPAIPVPVPNGPDTTIHFASEQLNFKISKTEFKEKKAATDYIRNTASKVLHNILEEEPERKIYVVGSIAVDSDGNKFDTHDISGGRAETVAKVLVENCGIPASNICVLDCGTNILPWRDTDEFQSGKWEEKDAAKNRVVTIICADEKNDSYKAIEPYINDTHIVK